MRDVIEKRFGLKGGSAKTLQAIGREYKITRERVRQIEADALRNLSRPEHLTALSHVVRTIQDHMEYHGGVMAEHEIMAHMADARHHPHVALLLDIAPSFTRLGETDDHHSRWTINKGMAEHAEKVLSSVVKQLEQRKNPVSEEELYEIIACASEEVLGAKPSRHVLESYLAASKVIRKNPYHEYGLVEWPTVSPAGAKDKAYVAIAKAGRPLHFREVADAINKAGWSKRKAHPQTVHNELIKDKRFVLVGRGLYALREWGYEPGAVRDVIASVLKEAKQPLSKEEIIERAAQKRFVKVPTILLNLQNRAMFRKTEEGKYMLV